MGIRRVQRRDRGWPSAAAIWRRRLWGGGIGLALTVGVLSAAPAQAAVEPSAPTNVTAVAGDGQATVRWTRPASDGGAAITQYRIAAQPGTNSQTIFGDVTSGVITGLTNGVTYTFTVKATNAASLTSPASVKSNPVVPGGGTPATAPGAPTGVTATAADQGATVSWTPPASDGGAAITEYRINVKPGTASLKVTAPATSAFVGSLTNGIEYTFIVQAQNAMGNGPWSDPSNPVVPGGGSPATVPGAPTNVTATPGDNQATVTWAAPADDGGSAITEYRVNVQPGTASVVVTAPATSTVFTGLGGGDPVTFTVKAINAVGQSVPSAPSNSVTPTGTPVTVPDPPTGVTAAPGNGSATVSWTPPANDGGSPVKEYRVNVQPGLGSQVVAAPATSLSFPGLTNGNPVTFTVKAINDKGQSVPSEPSNAVVPSASAGASAAGYAATTPTRVLDTRVGKGAPLAKVGAGKSVTVTLPGLPSDVSAVTLNVTATGATAATYLVVHAAGSPRPASSNVNLKPGQTVANLAVSRVGSGGKVSIFNAGGTVDIIADLIGNYSPTATAKQVSMTPKRVLDTRTGLGAATVAKVGAGQAASVAIPGLPAGTTAVTLNITATRASTSTWLVAYPTGSTRPASSNINLKAGQTVANLAVTRVGTNGSVSIYNAAGTVDVIVDVVGYYATSGTSRMTALTPARVLDTRYGTGAPKAKVGAGRTVTVTIPRLPAGATAATLNITATGATTSTFLVAYAGGSTRPSPYSNVNLTAGNTVANLAVTKVGAGGTVTIYNQAGSVDIIADVVAFYAP